MDTFGIVVVAALSALIWVIATRWLVVVVLSLLEGTPEEKRAGFVVGRMPVREDLLKVAMASGGVQRGAELLVAQALAEKWLLRERPARQGELFSVFEPRPGAPAWANALKLELGHRPDRAKVLRSALHVVERQRPALTSELVQLCVFRPVWQKAVAIASVCFSGALSTLVFARLLEMAEGGRLEELFVWGVALVFTLAMLGVALTLPTRTAFGERYLEWLLGATTAVADQAEEGRLDDPRDVGLVVATRGLHAVRGKAYSALLE